MMVDIAYGPEAGKRPDPGNIREAYLEMVRRKRMYGGILLVIFVALMASGWMLADERNAGGFWNGLPQVFDFPSEVISEAWEKRAAIPALFLAHVPALIETLNIAAVATLLGALAAMALSLLATRGLARWPRLIPLFRRTMDALRAIPEIVIALVLIYILGGGPVPAVIAIALHTGGALGKLFSEVPENADLKPVEGLASVGATWSQRMWLGVIPQVAPNWLSYALLRFEINVRASAILGFVGEGGIGHDLKLAMQWGQGRYDEVVAIFLLLFAAIVVIDRISDHYRHKLVKGH
jgi:phosphonate transport system permease protein